MEEKKKEQLKFIVIFGILGGLGLFFGIWSSLLEGIPLNGINPLSSLQYFEYLLERLSGFFFGSMATFLILSLYDRNWKNRVLDK